MKKFSIKNEEANSIPSIFINYQREDQTYASDVAKYINCNGFPVYFDLDDSSLRFATQIKNPENITNSIRNGIANSDYMIVIISPTTFKSFWVPFEIGFAYDKLQNAINILKHKNIDDSLPDYLKSANVLMGFKSLDIFLNSITNNRKINENISTKMFSNQIHPLAKYLDKA